MPPLLAQFFVFKPRYCRHHCHTCAIIEHNSRSSLFPLYPHPSSLCTILNQINNQISLQFCTLIELLNSIAILYKHSNAILIYWCVIILVIASFTLNTGNIRIQMDRPFGSTSFTFLVEDMGATKSIKNGYYSCGSSSFFVRILQRFFCLFVLSVTSSGLCCSCSLTVRSNCFLGHDDALEWFFF